MLVGAPLAPTVMKTSPRLLAARDRALAKWESDPWLFLTGVDPDDGKTPIYWTKDEKQSKQDLVVRPYPGYMEYLPEFVRAFWSWPTPERYPLPPDVDHQVVVADKSRQMITTTTCCGLIVYDMGFHRNRNWILSKDKLDGAKEIIRDKVRYPISRMPQWLQEHFGFSTTPQDRVHCKATDSHLLGATENVAESEARGGTYTGILIDEGARQETFGAIVAAAVPNTYRVWGLSTPAIAGMGAVDYSDYLELEQREEPDWERWVR